MKRMIALFMLVIPLFAANAMTTNVWTNGSGDFLIGTSGNWENGHIPENGDYLRFPVGIAATNNLSGLEISGLEIGTSETFTLGGEQLVLQAGAGVDKASGGLTVTCPVQFEAGSHRFAVADALRLMGAISGPGNIEVVCEMTKQLEFAPGNIGFSGDIWATNSCLTTSSHRSADHTGMNNNVHVRRWIIYGNGNQLSSNLFIYEDTGSTLTPGIHDYCSSTGLKGDLSFMGQSSRFRRDNTGSAFVVKGKTALPSSGVLYPWCIGAVKFQFDGPVSGSRFYTTGGQTGTFTFNSSGNTFSSVECYEGGANFVFAVPDSMPHSLSFYFAVDKGSLSVAGDQTCLEIKDGGGNGDNHFVTSTVPSTITMKGNWNRNFGGALLGDLSLKWSPTSAAPHNTYTLTSTRNVNTMNGALIVDKGTMEVTAGQSFPNLTAIVINDGATLVLPAGVAVNPALETITLAANAHLQIEEGVALTPTLFYVDGQKMWAKETYTGVDGASGAKQIAQITGAGTVTPRKGKSGIVLILR